MEFADSEICQTQWQGDDLLLVFSAVAATRRVAGESVISGYLQGVELLLRRCAPASTAPLFGRVRSGGLRVQGALFRRSIAVPSAWDGPLGLELEPAQAGVVLLQAQGLECRLQAGGNFRESLFC